jgi:mannose-6-phosphate isomerase-like protein (cupin superfamily)
MSFERPTGAAQGFVVGDGVGDAIELPGWSLRIKVSASDTAGRLTLLEGVMAPGHAGPLEHLHMAHEEAFFILRGSVRFRIGNEYRSVGPGETAFAPRGLPHGFSNPGDDPARYLALLSPSGYETYFARLAALIGDHETPPDRAALIRLMAEHGTFPVDAEGNLL